MAPTVIRSSQPPRSSSEAALDEASGTCKLSYINLVEQLQIVVEALPASLFLVSLNKISFSFNPLF